MKKFIKFIDEHFEEYILVFLLGLIAIIMFIQVIMRFVFRSPLSWPEELCRYLYIWMVFLGLSYTMKTKTELKIDLLEKSLPIKARKVFNIFIQLIGLGLYVLFFFKSISVYKQVYSFGQLSPAAGIPMYLVYLSIPVSCLFAIIRITQGIIGDARKKVDGGVA